MREPISKNKGGEPLEEDASCYVMQHNTHVHILTLTNVTHTKINVYQVQHDIIVVISRDIKDYCKFKASQSNTMRTYLKISKNNYNKIKLCMGANVCNPRIWEA